MVKDEGGQWSTPIQVFSNADEIVYIPDITHPGWAQWHAQAFKEQHMYFVHVYTYLRKERVTVQELVHVNTQTQRVLVERFLRPPLQVDLRTSSPTMSKTVANITKIVQDSIDHFHGPSVKSAVDAQKYAIAKMLACSTGDPDCNLSDADFAKKHPIYPRTSPQLAPGAVPGVNCGVGTNKSCCCAGGDGAVTPPVPQRRP